jgi:NitT/TauT family transport system substrate-binding protein
MIAAGLALAASFQSGPASARKLLLAEPVHVVSFLPVYVAKQKGFFKDEGIELTIQGMSAGAFVTAVITKQAFAFLGSVDHNAFAKVKGAELRAVSNLVARSAIYIMARTDLTPVKTDLATFMRGKTIGVATFGRTPNSVLRWLLSTLKLKPGKDVTLIETSSAGITAAVRSGRAQLGVSNEPIVSKGIKAGFWAGPIYNLAKEMGPVADTAVSVHADSIKNDPKLVKGLVRAVMRGLKYTQEHPDELLGIAKKEYPTMAEADLRAALDRSVADQVWSKSGFIPRAAWKTSHDVVRLPGLLKQDVSYDQVIDMRFVNEIQPTLK